MNVLLTTPPLDVYEQMALDEILVQERSAGVSLRFYRWTGDPAVTFGYAQNWKEVARLLDSPCACTRRATGGGVVFHTDDLTFSLIFTAQGRPAEIYRQLHSYILAELKQAGEKELFLEGEVPKESYFPSNSRGASACFIRPVESDVLLADGHKILGGAIRRFGTTVLYQGSLQLPEARKRPSYRYAITQAVRSFLVTDLAVRPVSPVQLDRAREKAKNVYETTAWKEKF
jgi:lipoate-protein ligase A